MYTSRNLRPAANWFFHLRSAYEWAKYLSTPKNPIQKSWIRLFFPDILGPGVRVHPRQQPRRPGGHPVPHLRRHRHRRARRSPPQVGPGTTDSSLVKLISFESGFATEFWKNLPKLDSNPNSDSPNSTNEPPIHRTASSTRTPWSTLRASRPTTPSPPTSVPTPRPPTATTTTIWRREAVNRTEHPKRNLARIVSFAFFWPKMNLFLVVFGDSVIFLSVRNCSK